VALEATADPHFLQCSVCLDFVKADKMDPTPMRPAAQRHSPTSVDAAESVRFNVAEKRRQVHFYLLAHPSTDEEGSEATGIQLNTYRPRRIELMKMEPPLVEARGQRFTKSRRLAVVWGGLVGESV
jgi:hypothetical protein